MADAMFAELLKRAGNGQVPELQERPSLTAPDDPSSPATTPLNPRLVGVLGTLADTASTYRFLKNGSKREDNALLGGLPQHPEKMALLGAGLAAGKYALAKLLAKKAPRVANTLDAQIGALQLGYAGHNMMDDRGSAPGAYSGAMQAELMRRLHE